MESIGGTPTEVAAEMRGRYGPGQLCVSEKGRALRYFVWGKYPGGKTEYPKYIWGKDVLEVYWVNNWRPTTDSGWLNHELVQATKSRKKR